MNRQIDDEIRQDLLARRQELNERLERIQGNYLRGLDADSEERAKQLADRDVVHALGSDAIAELALIKDALQRLDTGQFGRCECCGETILPERMKACHYATTCMDCTGDDMRRRRSA